MTEEAPAGELPREALVILAEGSAGNTPENLLALELARWARRKRCFSEVEIACLAGHPALEEKLASIASVAVRIYPLMLAGRAGVERAISSRLSISNGMDSFGHRVRIDDPLGDDPHLAGVLLESLKETAAAHAISAEASMLLIWISPAERKLSCGIEKRVADQIARTLAFREVLLLPEESRVGIAPKNGHTAMLLILSTVSPEVPLTDITRSFGENLHVVRQLGGYAAVLELAALRLSI